MRARVVRAWVGAMLGLYAHARTNDERLYEILRILRPRGRKSAQNDGVVVILSEVSTPRERSRRIYMELRNAWMFDLLADGCCT